MEPTRIVMMDLDPHTCPEDHGGQLMRLLHSCTSTSAIDMQTVTHFPPETFSSPLDLIVLRPSAPEGLSAMIQLLRSRQSLAPIVGLFCTGMDKSIAVWHSFLDELDDFLSCPIREIDVYARVQRLLQGKRETTTAPQAMERKAQYQLEDLVGESGPFLRVLHLVLRVAHSDATVLISGETGTGKELIARAIHYHSTRQDKPFVPVNCGALPDHLVENELFGHVKGAFTDASSPQTGLVVEAEKGSIFLDEVDTLSPSAQVKLLRFLQDREYRPLGSAKTHIADVRIIAATNADLLQQVQARQFREDLYYRLNIIALRLPPLRERSEDIPLLASHFLRRYEPHYGRKTLRLSTDTLHKLVAYSWPGNVRELETIIQRAVILASSPTLQPDDIDLSGLEQSPVFEPNSFREAKLQVIEQFERTYLTNLLATYEGNITQAAKHAGQPRRSLQRLLKKYNLNRCAS